MAINLDDRYPGRANGKTLSYPQGSFKNRTSPTSKDGTYLEEDWANDWAAFFQSLMSDAGMTASGTVDTVQASQYFDALVGAMQKRSIIEVATAPATKLSNLIYAVDRDQILRWQTIGTFTGYASPEVGLFHWGTTTTPRPFEELLIGQTIDGTLAKYQALIAWANAQGLVVSSGSWTAGTYNFVDLGSGSYKMPDLRNMFIRATGTDADTANARVLGSTQADALQNITGTAQAFVHVTNSSATGALYNSSSGISPVSSTAGTTAVLDLNFDASRSPGIRTSSETRGPNTALAPMIFL